MFDEAHLSFLGRFHESKMNASQSLSILTESCQQDVCVVLDKTESSSPVEETDVKFILFSQTQEPEIEYLDQEDDVIHMIDHPNGTRLAKHGPLLNQTVAGIVSSLSLATRVSLRVASLTVGTLFQSLKFSATATLGLGRKTLVSAVSTARNLHLMALRQGAPG